MAKASLVPRLNLPDDRNHVENWRENVSSLWEVETTAEEGSRFRGASVVHHFGKMIMGQVEVSAHHAHRSLKLLARMNVDHLLIQLRLSGRFHADADGQKIMASPGDVVLFDMSRPLMAWNTDYIGITLAVPRSLLSVHLGNLDAVHGLVLPGQTPLGSLMAQHIRSLAGLADDLTLDESTTVATGSAALFSACIGPALSLVPKGAEENQAPALAIAIRRFIESNLRDHALSPSLVARQFGLSRSSLYRAFEPIGSVATYIRHRRLAAAHRDLTRAGSSSRVQEIAYRWSFNNISAFNDAFRRRYGASPREVRDEATRSKGPVGPKAPLNAWTDLYTWVATLDAPSTCDELA